MKEQIVSFEVAKLAKEKGFIIDTELDYFTAHKIDIQNATRRIRKDCYPKYIEDYFIQKEWEDYCTFPTQSLLQKWIREVHGIHVDLAITDIGWAYRLISLLEKDEDLDPINLTPSYAGFKTYEYTLEKGLKEALTLIKTQ